jgi:WhiB family redox-sensing transcriptional regulator
MSEGYKRQQSERLDEREQSLSRGWMDLAACRGNPEPFLANRGRTYRQARAICAGCPVRTKCLDFAVAGGRDVMGYWGGTSERQRQWLRARRGAAA